MIKAKILAAIIAVMVLGAAITPAIQPAQAFAPGVPNSIDWNDFFTHLRQSIEYELLKSATSTFITGAVNKAMSVSGIKQYDTYLQNLSNQVYVSSTIKNDTARDAYLTRALINDSIGFSGTHPNLDPLYTQAALSSCNIYDVNKTKSQTETFLFLANCGGNPASSPQMQKIAAQNRAVTVASQSQQYATLDILAPGFKSSYNCSSLLNGVPPPNGVVPGDVNLAKTNCVVQNPAAAASTYFNHQIASALDIENKPQDNEDAAARAIAKPLSNILFQKFFGKAIGSVFGNTTIPLALGNLPTSALANPKPNPNPASGATFAFQAFDNKGGLLGTTSAQIFQGDRVFFKWDASKVSGVDHVIFSNGDSTVDVNQTVVGQIGALPNVPQTFSIKAVNASGQVVSQVETIQVTAKTGSPPPP